MLSVTSYSDNRKNRSSVRGKLKYFSSGGVKRLLSVDAILEEMEAATVHQPDRTEADTHMPSRLPQAEPQLVAENVEVDHSRGEACRARPQQMKQLRILALMSNRLVLVEVCVRRGDSASVNPPPCARPCGRPRSR